MVLQRWQSILLFLALILMTIFCLNPIGNVDENSICICSDPVYLVLNIVIAVLLLIDIFLYRNMRHQIRVAAIIILLQLVSLAIYLYYMFTIEAFEFNIVGLVIIASAITLTYIGRKLMIKDRKLLADSDRIR